MKRGMKTSQIVIELGFVKLKNGLIDTKEKHALFGSVPCYISGEDL